MTNLHQLLDDIESADTLRGSVEKLVDGLVAAVREGDSNTVAQLIAMRPLFVMAVTTNTSHIAVKADSQTRIEALAAVVNSPNVDHAARVVALEAEIATLTGERDATALLLLGANKDREALREALKHMQDAVKTPSAETLEPKG